VDGTVGATCLQHRAANERLSGGRMTANRQHSVQCSCVSLTRLEAQYWPKNIATGTQFGSNKLMVSQHRVVYACAAVSQDTA